MNDAAVVASADRSSAMENSNGYSRGGITTTTTSRSSAIPAASMSFPGRATKRVKKSTATLKTTTKTTTRDVAMGEDLGREEKIRSKRKKKKEATTDRDRFVKRSSLVLLVAQTVGLVTLMRYTRTRKDGEMYLASSAVFVMEVIKFIVCCGVIIVQKGYNASALVAVLRHNIVDNPQEVMKLSVPSLLYTIQNNLLYLALTNLDAATYQVLYQLKILTTALFSAVLLRRHFSPLKWSSLVLLTIGVAIVQTSGSGDAHHASEALETTSRMRTAGLLSVLCAACTSGFSGVYFERILKGSDTGLWERNVQMGLPSVLVSFVAVHVRDGRAVSERGMFAGWTVLVWAVVVMNAVGGLLVALVVKYADNVLKVFATSISIVVSCVVSAVLFEFRPNLRFVLGTMLVLASTVMYGRPEKKRRKKTVLPMTMTIERSSRSGGVRKSSLVL